MNSISRVRYAVILLGASVLAFGAATARDRDAPFPDPVTDAPLATAPGEQIAVLAGGCFWGVDAVFRHVRGVKAVTSGYVGGDAKTANYAAVSGGGSGHAESVKIVFDPASVSYGRLLKVFFAAAHDPTQLDRQGPDIGTQYRSAIFYTNAEQEKIAAAYINQLERARIYAKPIVTQVSALPAFYAAETYHQNYLALHPNSMYIVINDLPKLERLKAGLPALYRP